MKLHYSPASPFVRKVMVTLHETGQVDQVELIDTHTGPMSTPAGLASANPLGKLPALERDDGPTLYDSRVICAFLEARVQAGLYGEDARHWDILILEATADGIMDAAVTMVYESRFRPEEAQQADWVEGQWSKVTRSLDVLGQRWMSHLYGPLDMGQIALACALSYLDFRHGDRDWRAGRDALAAWHKGFCERDSMQATVPPAG